MDFLKCILVVLEGVLYMGLFLSGGMAILASIGIAFDNVKWYLKILTFVTTLLILSVLVYLNCFAHPFAWFRK